MSKLYVTYAMKEKAWRAYRKGINTDHGLAKVVGISFGAFQRNKKPFLTFFRQMDKREKRRGKGRPKSFEEGHVLLKAEVVRSFGYSGYSQEDVCRVLGCSRDTLRKYFTEHPDIKQEFLTGKDRANQAVEDALLRRAKGMKIKRVKFATFQGTISDSREYQEELPPDVHAQELWLVNRSPDRWNKFPSGGGTNEKTEYDIREGLYNEGSKNTPEEEKNAE